MKSDIYSLYQNNQHKLGFWIKKNHWENHLARVVKLSGVEEGEALAQDREPKVIAFLLDTRTNELEECVELNNPKECAFIEVQRDIEPKNILPEKLASQARKMF